MNPQNSRLYYKNHKSFRFEKTTNKTTNQFLTQWKLAD